MSILVLDALTADGFEVLGSRISEYLSITENVTYSSIYIRHSPLIQHPMVLITLS